MDRIKVFGERNTGTRAVMQMIRPLPNVSAALPDGPKSSDKIDAMETRVRDRLKGRWLRMYLDVLKDERRELGGGIGAWKHAAPKFDQSFVEANASVLFMVRDPYSWAVSIARRPYHIRASKHQTFESFLDTPWMTMTRDRTQPVLNSPVNLWVEKLRAYQIFIAESTVQTAVLRFEDFIENPVGTLGNTLVGFKVSADGLSQKSDSTKDAQTSVDDLKTYYRNDRWKERLTRGSVTLINRFMDWDLAEHYGYTRLNPDDYPENLNPEIRSQIAFELAQKV